MERSLLIGGILLAVAAVASFAIGRTRDGSPVPKRDPATPEVTLPDIPPRRGGLKRTGGPTGEPSYAGAPSYCQVALGRGGATRHWLVLSGRFLHVDRDGNGDVTGDGEKVEGSVDGGRITHGEIVLQSGAEAYSLNHVRDAEGRSVLTVDDPRKRAWGAWGDERGPLRFAGSPADAPVVRMDGPLEMGIETHRPISREGQGKYKISAGVGCRGLGPGSFAHLKEKWVPADAAPEAIVEFPGPGEGIEPVVVKLSLDHRC